MTDRAGEPAARSTEHPALRAEGALLAMCDVRRQRRSGPGGQHRNKVESGIILVHRPTGVRAEATERRSQHENKRVAIARLRVNLALHVRGARGAPFVVSARWHARTRSGQIHVSPHHDDFPGLLAEALDAIDRVDYDVPKAAKLLAVTNSQLVRFLKLDPRALELVNEQRRQRDKHPLR